MKRSRDTSPYQDELDRIVAMNNGEPIADERRLRDQVCPQCRQPFELCWNDYSDRKQTLILRGCPSGGIYDVSIHCPHCNYGNCSDDKPISTSGFRPIFGPFP